MTRLNSKVVAATLTVLVSSVFLPGITEAQAKCGLHFLRGGTTAAPRSASTVAKAVSGDVVTKPASAVDGVAERRSYSYEPAQESSTVGRAPAVRSSSGNALPRSATSKKKSWQYLKTDPRREKLPH
jgi:hypothetical protein